jgi:hypothetical protein
MITVQLTPDQARALLWAYDINEFPVSNVFGRKGPDLLDSAEDVLRAALVQAGEAEEPAP